jgi:hypothetical protein
MMPLDYDGKGTKYFILGPTLDLCHFGVTGGPNEWIFVRMNKKTRFAGFSAVTVFGKLEVGEVRRHDILESFYRLEGAVISFQN